jgi:hypothetical protein
MLIVNFNGHPPFFTPDSARVARANKEPHQQMAGQLRDALA